MENVLKLISNLICELEELLDNPKEARKCFSKLSGVKVKGNVMPKKRREFDYKELDISIVRELAVEVPEPWRKLIKLILNLTRAYSKTTVEALVCIEEDDSLEDSIASGDLNRLLVDKARLSALNVRLGLIAGIMGGKAKGAYSGRQTAQADAYLEAKSEAFDEGRKVTQAELGALSESATEADRLLESEWHGACRAIEFLMHRTKDVIFTLGTAIDILHNEKRQVGDIDDGF